MTNPFEQKPFHESPPNRETFAVDGKEYYNDVIAPYAETLPVVDIPLSDLEESVSERHYYWEDENGDELGPFQLLADWETAKKNAAWGKHVATIENANLDEPIWILEGRPLPIDGMHRLTRAFRDNCFSVKGRVLGSLSDEALVEQKEVDSLDTNS